MLQRIRWKVIEEDSLFTHMLFMGICTYLCTPAQIDIPYTQTDTGVERDAMGIRSWEVISNSPVFMQLANKKERRFDLRRSKWIISQHGSGVSQLVLYCCQETE